MISKVQEFLKEDIGSGDITSELVVPKNARAKGRIVCKEDCVVAGLEEAAEVFVELGATVTRSKKDGSRARKGDTVLEVTGPARAILAGERLALNFVMRMSGIATLTDDLVRRCRKINPEVRVAATRKTTPGFREFEKKAVLLGGGDPHRGGLDDAVLIKDNHIRLAGGVAKALQRAKRGSFTKKIEIEVENPRDARTAVENGADIVMLDNFKPEAARKLARELRTMNPEVLVEVSGGIRPENIEEYADAADIISLGWLTHSVRSADFSMAVERL
ncbi:MAG: nicotinate-nucleotide diphosphorylase (carboxylating) [Euryarchaeota archaeon RBG_16_62_10]|nr:MAG: nicotinate-nucleotide diphosphorylase (carboxylating) [Euryarchaeota archaeon RBG_16_62_10]